MLQLNNGNGPSAKSRNSGVIFSGVGDIRMDFIMMVIRISSLQRRPHMTNAIVKFYANERLNIFGVKPVKMFRMAG